MEPLYKLNDKVVIKKEFSNESGGECIECNPKIVSIVHLEKTPTYGWIYKLQDNSRVLPVYYDADDIEGLVEDDYEENYWIVWGSP